MGLQLYTQYFSRGPFSMERQFVVAVTALAHLSEGRELLPGKTGSYWASQRVQLMWVLIWG